MDDNNLDEKFQRVEDRLDTITQVLTKNTVILDEHIRRTNLLEEEMKPIKDHVKFINFAAKAISTIAAAAVVVKQLGLF